MNILPKVMQPFLTWLTSVPSQEELRSWDGNYRSPTYHVIAAFFKLCVGLAMSTLAFFHAQSGLPLPLAALLFLAGFVVTTSAMRKFQVVIYHNCAHAMVFKSKTANRVLGTLIAITLLLKNFDQYQVAHRNHHHSKKLLTHLDDTLNFLVDQLGIKPTDTPRTMWSNLIRSIFSPLYHARQLIGRVGACCFVSDTPMSILAVVYWGGVAALAMKLSLGAAFLAIWMLPMVIGYQMSLALRLCAEHCWPDRETLQTRGPKFVALSTTSVFMGEPLVLAGNGARQAAGIAWWATKMLTKHAFFRLFVMVGDTPCHDFHHRRPSDKSWTNYPFARARDKASGCVGFTSNYIDSWGLVQTISANFTSFSQCAGYYKGLYQ